MKSFVEQAKWYASYHQLAETRYAHMAGLPLILLSILIFLGFFHLTIPPVVDLHFSCMASLALLVYYFYLQWMVALVFSPVLLVLLWVANLITSEGLSSFSIWSFLIILILGALPLIYSHLKENKRPSFMDNPWQVLASPLFLTAELLFMTGKFKKLKESIHNN